MKYFLHDSNSFNDEKITELFIEFGFEGLGLFYTLLEKIAQQEKPIKTDVLKHQLKVGKKLEKCWQFMESIELLSSINGETFNKQLLNYSEKYQIKSQKNRDRISKWRDKQEDTKNVTHSENVRNASKVKVNKVKVDKDKEVNSEPKGSMCASVSLDDKANGVITYLNKKADRNYKHTATNRTHIIARLKEDYTAHDVKFVINLKCEEWKGKDEWDKHLNCITLFRASNFERYLNENPKYIPKQKELTVKQLSMLPENNGKFMTDPNTGVVWMNGLLIRAAI